MGATLGWAAIVSVVAITPAAAAGSGGAIAPTTGGGAGGAEYGTLMLPISPPRATQFSVSPGTVTAGGSPPSIALRIDSADGGLVRARLVFSPVTRGPGRTLRIDLGRLRAGRTLHLRWPKGSTLRAGRYIVRVHATDVGGRPLQRGGRTSGRAVLTVRPRPAPKPKPAPVAPLPAPLRPAGIGSGVFPVQGPHAYGDTFGVARKGYSHHGVDITAAQGTQIVSPTAGTIRYTDYQASAAGEYIVERLADGRDVFYAHCVRHSTVVAPGQPVARGAALCRVGSTGDATGPHLHIELWPGGWRDIAGTAPVDPMSQLEAWDGHG